MRRLERNRSIKKRGSIENLEPRQLLAADPIISEFQASNVSTLFDEDGDSSDWIEIRNPDSAAVELGGWYLTDDAEDLTKWQFPATSLGAGEELIVFASNKDRVDGELHANFRLSRSGEFLAIVKPDGVTISQSYATYPPQEIDQSYGLAAARESTVLLDQGAAVSVHIPQDDSLGQSWTQLDFDDNAWRSGLGAVGFEQLRPQQTTTENFAAPLSDDWTIDVPTDSLSTVAVADGGLAFSVPADEDISGVRRGIAPQVFRSLPNSEATDWEVIAEITKESAGERGSVGIGIYDAATGTMPIQLEQSIRRTFSFTSAGSVSEVSMRQSGRFFLRLTRNEVTKTWVGYGKVEEADEWTELGSAVDGTFGGPIISEPRISLFARTPDGTFDGRFEQVDIDIAEQRPVYAPLIATDVGASMLGVNSSAYVRIPFEVPDATSFDVLSLGARFDDGFRAYINGTAVASSGALEPTTWNSNAVVSHGAIIDRIPQETFDISAAAPQLVAGTNVLAIQGLNRTADDLDFLMDMGLVGSRLATLEARSFSSPSPGQPNLAPQAPQPQLVGNDGVFFGAQTVALQLEPGAPESLEIRYTLDGSEPTDASQLYAGPISITASSLLQARTFDTLAVPNFRPSQTTSQTFLALAPGLQQRDSQMPLMVIDTLGAAVPPTTTNDLERAGAVIIDVDPNTGSAMLSDTGEDYLGRVGIRRRGSSTGSQPKPQLTLETWGPNGTDRDDDYDASLLGMAADSDWVMHAPFGGDRTFMKNRFAYELSNQLGRWAPDTRFMEVYLNDGSGLVSESHYVGIYVLTERIKDGDHRVDVAAIDTNDNAEPDVSGGYIFKFDRPDPSGPAFQAGGTNVNWVTPESPLSTTATASQKATDEQQQWLTNYLDAFAATLETPDINDPEGYSKYIDVDAWIDHHLLNVLMFNADALVLSGYFHKDRGEKLKAGPIWDFNLSMESTDERDDDPYRWLEGAAFFTAPWWSQLKDAPGFWQRYVDRYVEFREDVLTTDNFNGMIARFADEVGDAAARNYARWEQSPREFSGFNSGYLDGTYAGEIAHMQAWLAARIDFLDSMFAPTPVLRVNDVSPSGATGQLVADGSSFTLTPQPIESFNDAFLVAGEQGVSTGRYFVPTDNSLAQTWTETSFDDSTWAVGTVGIGFDANDDLAAFVSTEVDPREQGSPSIFTRFEFNLDDLNDVESRDLVLRLQYDDGYIAYINGTRVSRNNLRSSVVSWDALATNQSDEDASVFEEYDISRFKDSLVSGKNVLAIQVMNSSSASSELLIVPQLVLRESVPTPNLNSQVYWTLDGTDPLGPDGTPTATAQIVDGAQPISVDESMQIVARSFDENQRGDESSVVLTQWSAPVTYNLITQTPEIFITEINYNPGEITDAEQGQIPDLDGDQVPDWTRQDFEFIELYNRDANPADFVAAQLRGGVSFDFSPDNVPAPGSTSVLVRNVAAFEMRYGTEIAIAGTFDGQLDNAGETLRIVDGTGVEIARATYGDETPWPLAADGFGGTLELVEVAGNVHDLHSNWTSGPAFGTPGRLGASNSTLAISEVVSNPVAPARDAVELVNLSSDTAVDLTNVYLSDSGNDLRKYQFPAGTQIAPQQRLVVDAAAFNPTPNAPANNHFGLSGTNGDQVWVSRFDANGNLLSILDAVRFGASRPNESLSRAVETASYLAPTQPTLGSLNSAPLIGDVVVSEVHYAPSASDDARLAAGDLEFIELLNRSQARVPLTDWELDGGVDYRFDDDTELAVDERLVVVRFNVNSPDNAARLIAFREHYGLDETVQIVGGYDGRLSNTEDRIVILSPTPVAVGGAPMLTLVDEVLYQYRGEWPTSAASGNASLQRRSPIEYGSRATSWTASPPSPGTAGEQQGDFNNDQAVDEADIQLLFAAIAANEVDRQFDLNRDDEVDASDLDALIIGVLGTTYGDANLDGVFNSRDFVDVFTENEYEDAIAGNSTWSEGDWNGDGDFNTNDLVLAFQRGGYRV